MERVSIVDVATLCTFGSRHKLYQSLGNWSFLNGSIKRIGHKIVHFSLVCLPVMLAGRIVFQLLHRLLFLVGRKILQCVLYPGHNYNSSIVFLVHGLQGQVTELICILFAVYYGRFAMSLRVNYVHPRAK